MFEAFRTLPSQRKALLTWIDLTFFLAITFFKNPLLNNSKRTVPFALGTEESTICKTMIMIEKILLSIKVIHGGQERQVLHYDMEVKYCMVASMKFIQLVDGRRIHV